MNQQATTHSKITSHRKSGSASSKTISVKAERKDVCQQVTDSIIKILERGVKPWSQPWQGGSGAMPLRYSGERYRGVNILILWCAQHENGYSSNYWMTYQQAAELGGQVRKGEGSTAVVYYGTATKRDDDTKPADQDEASQYRFLKSFSVFNAAQIDNLPERYTSSAPATVSVADRMPELDALVQSTGATIHHGGNRAYYQPGIDTVQMPDFEAFKSAEFYYATLFHELAHWTKAPTRLNRDFGSSRWGDAGYAQEELVAELASAFLGAELGFAPEHIEDHASYLASWLKALKNDKRLIFAAAAKAQAAADFICRPPL